MILRIRSSFILVICLLMFDCKNSFVQFVECDSFTHNFWQRTYTFNNFKLKISCRELEPIDPCNPISDYYDGKTHYIRRDLVTDEGNLDYKKLLEDTKPQNSECYPANHEVK